MHRSIYPKRFTSIAKETNGPTVITFPVLTQTRDLDRGGSGNVSSTDYTRRTPVSCRKKEEEGRRGSSRFEADGKDSRIGRKLAVNPGKSHHVSNFPEIKRLDPPELWKSAN